MLGLVRIARLGTEAGLVLFPPGGDAGNDGFDGDDDGGNDGEGGNDGDRCYYCQCSDTAKKDQCYWVNICQALHLRFIRQSF